MKRLFAILLLFVFTPCVYGEIIYFANGSKYVGDVSNGLMNGQGTVTYTDGAKYVGEWKDNKAHGLGTYTHANGAKYVGEWKDDGVWEGVSYSASGEVEETASNGKWCGSCKPTARQLAIVREINEESKRAPKTQPATTTPNLGGTGTGFVINRNHVVTAHHVVDECREVTVTHSHTNYPTRVIARDSHNDLGLLRLQGSISGTAKLRSGRSIRLGENIATYGYPMVGTLANSASTSEGVINALAGFGNDSRFFRYDASTQPGNSGGPLLDLSGNVVGVISHRFKKETGVNFAIKSNIVENFLNSEGISFDKSESLQRLGLADNR